MRVLIALDGSKTGERAVAAVAAWARSAAAELHLISVVHPDDLRGTTQRVRPAEFYAPAGTESGHIPPMSNDPLAGQVLVPGGEPEPRPLETRAQAIERARAQRADYLHAVAVDRLAGLTPAVHVEFSEHPARAIVEAAEALGVDFIAMGTHGRSGIRHVLMGSIAEQVLRESRVPVLVVGPRV